MTVRELWGAEPPRAAGGGRRVLRRRAAARTSAPAPAIRPRSRCWSAAAERGIDRGGDRSANARGARVNPFDADRKRMSIGRADGVLYVKGAVELLLPLCASRHRRAPPRRTRRWRRAACACWASPSGAGAEEKDLRLLGLVGIADPPRTRGDRGGRRRARRPASAP